MPRIFFRFLKDLKRKVSFFVRLVPRLSEQLDDLDRHVNFRPAMIASRGELACACGWAKSVRSFFLITFDCLSGDRAEYHKGGGGLSEKLEEGQVL